MADYNITQVMASGDALPVVVGSITWTPEGWDYKTTDEEVERFLSAVKTDKSIVGYSSMTEGGAKFAFVEREVEESDPDFVGQLSDMMVRLTFNPEVPSTWIEPKNTKRG